jgi:hypothetical protein
MAEELIELGRTRRGGCPVGKVRRKGYRIKKGKAKGKYVESKCVEDQGKPGKTPKGKQVLPDPTEGALSCKGRDWDHKQKASTRRSIIKCVVTTKLRSEPDPCRTGILNLNLLANFTKRTSPDTHKKARADMAWTRKQAWCKLKTKNDK